MFFALSRSYDKKFNVQILVWVIKRNQSKYFVNGKFRNFVDVIEIANFCCCVFPGNLRTHQRVKFQLKIENISDFSKQHKTQFQNQISNKIFMENFYCFWKNLHQRIFHCGKQVFVSPKIFINIDTRQKCFDQNDQQKYLFSNGMTWGRFLWFSKFIKIKRRAKKKLTKSSNFLLTIMFPHFPPKKVSEKIKETNKNCVKIFQISILWFLILLVYFCCSFSHSVNNFSSIRCVSSWFFIFH
jgi:hypothetical protein